MSSPVQKADAPDDASIPVLTERLTLPPLELDTTLPLELAPEPVAKAPPPAVPDAGVTGRPTAPAPVAAPARAAPPLSLDTTLPSGARPPPGPPTMRTAPAAPPRPAAVAAAAPAAEAPAAAPASAAAAAAATASSHWTRIELELRSSILQAIADALPQQIDSIVRNRMNDAIERTIAQLSAETRLAVAASLRDIVDQAVRSELVRLRGQKR